MVAGPGDRTNTGLLALIERAGNALPDPIFLFILATFLIVGLSAVGAGLGWSVQPVKPRLVLESVPGPNGEAVWTARTDARGRPVTVLVDAGDPIRARSLLTSDGLYWLIANLVRNFINFAPLGIVLVSMFGIGVAEKTGLFGAAMRYLAGIVPGSLLTPAVVFLGLMSHTATDAGYIVLPPLAAGLFAAFGRSPIVGVAAAFAGIGGGFSANLLISASDAIMAPLTERGARVIDPAYTVQVPCNWYFMAASTVLLTLMGWLVTSRVIEPRFGGATGGDAAHVRGEPVSPVERRGLLVALGAIVLTTAGAACLIAIPGAPLHGGMPAPAPAFGPVPLASGAPAPDWHPAPRWTQAVVPMIFVMFLVPGLAYGLSTRSIRRPSDVTNAFVYAMSSMAAITAMAFFAAQFIECFRFSRLDLMLASAGGKGLVSLGLPRPLLLIGLIAMVMLVNLLIASMSAKWTALTTILVPMLMMAGIAPELTQAAYRVGDSVTNTITPLNGYLIVILAVLQKYRKEAGLGNLIAMMLPYAVVFAVVWTGFLLLWVWLELPLGPGSRLWYTPGAPAAAGAPG